jgi:hypothetical protein
MSWSYPLGDTTSRQTNPAGAQARTSPCGNKPLGSKWHLETCNDSWRTAKHNNQICRNLTNGTRKLIPSHQPFGICALWVAYLRKRTSRAPMSWTCTLDGVPGNPPMFCGESAPMSWSYPLGDTTSRQTNPDCAQARTSPCGNKPLGSKWHLETCNDSWRTAKRNNQICRNLTNGTRKLIPSHQPFGICDLWVAYLRKRTSRAPTSWTCTLDGVPGNPPMFCGESAPMSWSYSPPDTTNRQTNPAGVLARTSPCGGKPLGSK